MVVKSAKSAETILIATTDVKVVGVRIEIINVKLTRSIVSLLPVGHLGWDQQQLYLNLSQMSNMENLKTKTNSKKENVRKMQLTTPWLSITWFIRQVVIRIRHL